MVLIITSLTFLTDFKALLYRISDCVVGSWRRYETSRKERSLCPLLSLKKEKNLGDMENSCFGGCVVQVVRGSGCSGCLGFRLFRVRGSDGSGFRWFGVQSLDGLGFSNNQNSEQSEQSKPSCSGFSLFRVQFVRGSEFRWFRVFQQSEQSEQSEQKEPSCSGFGVQVVRGSEFCAFEQLINH